MTGDQERRIKEARAVARAPWCYASAAITAALIDVMQIVDEIRGASK